MYIRLMNWNCTPKYPFKQLVLEAVVVFAGCQRHRCSGAHGNPWDAMPWVATCWLMIIVRGLYYPIPIGSMYAIYGNIYHQYTPNVSIYTIHGSNGSYGYWGLQ